MNSRMAAAWWLAAVIAGMVAAAAPQPPEGGKRMSLDVKDTDIRDAIRMVSKGYDLNIVLDKDVTGKVTVHLSDVPIMEGLRTLAEANGLEVVQDGSVYRIRRKSDEGRASIKFVRNKLTIDVQNMDVVEFIKELSSRTSVSIVADNKVQGKVTGKLFDVNLDDGIRAILEGNGFSVARRRNIYQVSAKGAGDEAGTPRTRRPAAGAPGDFFVDYQNGLLTIEVTNGNLEDVLKAISEQSDVQIVTYGSVRAEVNAKLYDRPLTEAFALLLGGTQFTFVEKDGIILIGDRNAATPAGQALLKSELIPLKHIKADEVPQVLPKNISANNVKVIKEQNALLVTGTSEDIVQMREFLKTIDIPTPQVRIDAVIVEYKDNLKREFGLRFWRSNKELRSILYQELPAPATSVSGANSDVELGASGRAFKRFFGIGNGILGRIPDDFFVVLRWLETQDKARILAQPSILTLNGRKASITVDETQYFKVTSVVSSLNEKVERIQPIKFGISLDITPWISQGGQITAEISPVVSNAEGTTADNYPNVSSRTLTTTVRLNDGETLKLGGLIKQGETKGMGKVPILGDLPIIGVLFRTTGRNRSKTNLVIYITPHIVAPCDTVNLERELRDYDLYLLNEMERRTLTGLRERRARRAGAAGQPSPDTTAAVPTISVPPDSTVSAAERSGRVRRSPRGKGKEE